MRSDLLPGSTPTANSFSLAIQAIPLTLFAGITAIAARLRKARWPAGIALRSTVLVGVGLFVAPALLIEITRGVIDDSTRVAIFSLGPVFALVFEPHLSSESSHQQRGSLMASLLAVAGTLLLFPLELPRSAMAALAFFGVVAAVASVAAANCLSVRLVREQAARSSLTFAAVAAGSAAIALALLGSVFERHARNLSLPDSWTALDLLALALLFWLMRRMTAVRITTRFLIAPLLANLVGLAFLHPGIQGRSWLGLLFIAAGSAWLLLGPEDEPEQTGPPLGIN